MKKQLSTTCLGSGVDYSAWPHVRWTKEASLLCHSACLSLQSGEDLVPLCMPCSLSQPHWLALLPITPSSLSPQVCICFCRCLEYSFSRQSYVWFFYFIRVSTQCPDYYKHSAPPPMTFYSFVALFTILHICDFVYYLSPPLESKLPEGRGLIWCTIIPLPGA